jgi:cell wall-associated NlpC family hydrolase
MLFLLGSCALSPLKSPTGPAGRDAEIGDVLRLPQKIAPYAAAAGAGLEIGDDCHAELLEEFRTRCFAPWTRTEPFFDLVEEKEVMTKVARGTWYGENRRVVPKQFLGELLDNCGLETLPTRNETAIAVAPAHLRGLPTRLPLFAKTDGYPFDMLQYPNVKLNEPLRVLHASRDGIWLYVETAYTCGWIEARDVAFADPGFIKSWMKRPQMIIIRDYTTVMNKEGTGFRAKIGTILPLVSAGEEWWDVEIAVGGDTRRAAGNVTRLPRAAAARLPLAFDRDNVALIGDQLIGQPYGWGEMYGMRDCSAMIRDFFMPFGIWLPRTAADQIASVPQTVDLAGLLPQEKAKAITGRGVPFHSLIYKPGHIMLYVGTDTDGRPLVFHSAWSIRVKKAEGEQQHFIGKAVITTLEPGKEMGLVEGATLLEQATTLATITDRCGKSRTMGRDKALPDIAGKPLDERLMSSEKNSFSAPR